MGSIGSLFGITGAGGSGTGAAGSGYQATSANVAQPVNTGDAINANTQAQQAFQQQQAFANAVNAQNGLLQQQNVLNQVNALNPVGDQGAVFQQQQALANQLQGMANGQGPNPAQAQLAQNTGNNISSQAALMAGQRGAGANAGLIARQAGQQGGALNQQAAGQAATLQAQQQLAAVGALQNQQAGLASQANQFAGQQQGLTNNMIGQQQQAVQGLNSNAQGYQGSVAGQLAAQNTANVAAQGNVNNANAGIANTVAGTQGQFNSGLLNGVGGALMAAQGGMVPKKYASGGGVAPQSDAVANPSAANAGSKVMQFLTGGSSSPMAPYSAPMSITQAGTNLGTGIGNTIKSAFGGSGSVDPQGLGSQFAGSGYGLGVPGVGAAPAAGPSLGVAALAKGGKVKTGKVDALVSPGEGYLAPDKVAQIAAKGGEKGSKILAESEKIPGQAKVKGDSYANDTVPKQLEEGGIVLPRHVTQSKNPGKEAEKFVNAVLAKQNMKRKVA